MATAVKKTTSPLLMILIGAVVVILGMGGAWYYLHLQSPEYAVQQILAAQDNKDLTTFEKYVDLDALANQVMVMSDSRLDEVLNESSEGAGQWAGGIKALAERAREQIRQKVGEYVTSAIRERVSNGTFSWHVLSVLKRGKLDELKTWIVTGTGATYLGQGPVTSTKKTAKAVLQYQNSDGTIDDVILQLQLGENGWQVVAVSQLE
jgi:hypothetical protein